MYVELKSKDNCKLYDKDGKLVCGIVPEGEIPTLKSGRNDVFFQCENPGKEDARVQVTLIGEGKPL